MHGATMRICHPHISVVPPMYLIIFNFLILQSVACQIIFLLHLILFRQSDLNHFQFNKHSTLKIEAADYPKRIVRMYQTM